MTRSLADELSTLRASQKVARVDGSDPVFTFPDGTALTKDRVRRLFDLTVDRCSDIPEEKRSRIVFYTLRHSAASLMLQNGASIFEVSKILGHSSPTITVARYGHFCPDAARDTVHRFDRAMDEAETEEEAESA